MVDGITFLSRTCRVLVLGWRGIVFRFVEDEETLFQVIEVEGHFIDPMIMSKVLDAMMDQRGGFEFLEFNVGKKKTTTAPRGFGSPGRRRWHLNDILGEVLRLGATLPETPEVEYLPVPADMVLPDE